MHVATRTYCWRTLRHFCDLISYCLLGVNCYINVYAVLVSDLSAICIMLLNGKTYLLLVDSVMAPLVLTPSGGRQVVSRRLPDGVRTSVFVCRSAAIYHNYGIIMSLLWEFMALL